MSLLQKLQKNSTIKEADILQDSKFFNEGTVVRTPVPMVNVALSGRLDGGLGSGLTIFAGPSKHFKTGFVLLLVKAYLDAFPDAVCLFYDSEFGSPQSYFESFGIPTDRILHTPITDIEQLKHDCAKQIDGLSRGDRVIIVVDSIGNLASKKEVDDALDGKSTADMTRAKQLKSFFRIITPHLTIKDLPMVVVGHTYKEMSLFPKDILSGGTGAYYSADTIFIVGRQQEKENNEVIGYNFVINIEKSRDVREKSKIPVSVTFEGGISTWSGLIDVALESGHVVKPSNGWYSHAGSDKKYRLKDTMTKEFWLPVLTDKTFQQWIVDNYALSKSNRMVQEITDEEIEREYSNV